MSRTEHETDEVELRAAVWVARLDGGPLTPAERASLRDWLEAMPDHRAAFEEAAATWRDLAALRRDPGPLRDLAATNRPRPSSPTRRAGRLGAVIGLLLLAGGLARYQFGDPWLLATADYRTEPGEVRSVTLPDGSVAELGPASAIAVEFTAQERRVRLLAGEVFFAAAPRSGAENRSFVVEAGGGTTTALGTQFVVEDEGEGADVLAVEHQIEVALDHGGLRQDVVLSPGQEVGYRQSLGLGRVRTRDVATATAWRRGMLVFSGSRLGHVVETLNRYRRGRIVILDSTLADRRVSGVFATKDLDDAIETITAELGVSARSIYPFMTVLY